MTVMVRLITILLFTVLTLTAAVDEDAQLGMDLFASERYKEALYHLDRAARKGSPPAQYYLAFMYLNELGVRRNDEKGWSYLMASAEAGYGEACFLLGRMLYMSRKYKTAFRWLTRGAREKHPKSMYMLGYMYEQGAGIGRNMSKARYWYRQAGIKE